MRIQRVLLTASTASLTLLPSIASASHEHIRASPHWTKSFLQPRNYVSSSQLADSYDFVIAGGGLAGLVLASRLSADPNTTVLVIEAGGTGDDVSANINPPAGTYYNSVIGTDHDWQYKTTSQSNVGDRSLNWPRGKLLGGSSAVNGMYWVRTTAEEINAWKSLVSSLDGSDKWSWDSLQAATQRAETFTAPSTDIQNSAKIQFNKQSYGSNGPLHVTYPGFMFAEVGDWVPTFENLGIPANSDPAGGQNNGPFVSTLTINPSNWTRSYSKSAYIDPLPPRKNLDILTSATVAKITFADNADSNGNRVASGVQFSTDGGKTTQAVKVNKEVLLNGGAVGSPHILLESGVGPKDVLTAANVPVINELPGVGLHLQDHLAVAVTYASKVETAGDLHASGSDFSKSPVAMSFVNSAISYINASALFGSGLGDFQNLVNSQASETSLIPSSDQGVIAGGQAIYKATQQFLTSAVGQVEMLFSINAPKNILIQTALQHPYSQGKMTINSNSIFDPPVIDPGYFSHPADIQFLREGIKLARKIGTTAPMSNNLGDEITPGPDVQSDSQIEDFIRSVAATEFHPTGACAMLPKDQGGVIDAKLKVYGLANVRVTDSSIFPISFAAHLMTATYGVAETAADIIEAQYKPTSSSSPSGTSSGSGSQPTSGGSNQGNGAISIASSTLAGSLVVFMSIFLTSLL